MRFEEGKFYGIYKPEGVTSFSVVAKVRKISGIKRVGHAGTLDPLACGVLVVAVGRDATKGIDKFVKKEKEYVAEIMLGFESTTDDREGEKIEYKKSFKFLKKSPELGDVKKVLKKFVGKIEQVPPVYSALKINGKPAYKYARGGEVLDMEKKKREVEIFDIEVLEYKWPILKIKVNTGSGVYIRSLARDVGRQMGVGGYLRFLERTRVGGFKKEDCVNIESLK